MINMFALGSFISGGIFTVVHARATNWASFAVMGTWTLIWLIVWSTTYKRKDTP